MNKKTILAGALLLVLTACGGSQKAPAVSVESTVLFAEYEKDQAAADKKYLNRIIEVLGDIEDIAEDADEKTYVALKGSGLVFIVQCFFSESGKAALDKFAMGDPVRVRGKCTGKTKAGVVLTNCKISAPEKPPAAGGTDGK